MYRCEYGEPQTANTMLSTELKNCKSRIKFLKDLVNSYHSDNVFLKRKVEEDQTYMDDLKKNIDNLQHQLNSVVDRSADACITFQEVVVKEMQKHFPGQNFD